MPAKRHAGAGVDLASKNASLALYEKFAKLPKGTWLFSRAASLKAPYFRTIRPSILDFRPGRIEVAMKKRWAVHNHIGTVHAIACCNLAEFAMGVMVDLSRPAHIRWIPAGMDVQYLKKADSDLRAVAELPAGLDWEREQIMIVPVQIFNRAGVEVVHADIRVKISRDPKAAA